ncbi:hypothetical protein KPH14_011521 [Odynerus spinipes]|uniref:Potassium/sodium hyperpolarization-activated cyclic nucleotide-gated channel 2 n=1 Tax=Odynerus spinipes TaxID=1348599 RepID=A0AAD9VN08_9HYME|nr:hypothetical protein KPH14_011521 [Odynerus spinipes]
MEDSGKFLDSERFILEGQRTPLLHDARFPYSNGKNRPSKHAVFLTRNEMNYKGSGKVHFGVDDVSLYGTPKEEPGPGLPGQEVKQSFLKNQLQALFQPTDNKLAMKLFGSKKALMKERIRQKAAGHWVIHPCSSFRFYWDLCMLLLLVANLIILPVAISFFNDDLSTRWIAFNCLSDTIFLIDIVVNFRTGIMQQDNAEQVILDPKLIAKHYLRTWFFLDLISSIPLDYIFLIFNQFQDFSESFQILHAGRALRILRLAKLLSLVRLLRLSRLVRSLSSMSGTSSPMGSPCSNKDYINEIDIVRLAHCENTFPNGFADPPLSTAGEALRASGDTAPTRPNQQGVPA